MSKIAWSSAEESKKNEVLSTLAAIKKEHSISWLSKLKLSYSCVNECANNEQIV